MNTLSFKSLIPCMAFLLLISISSSSLAQTATPERYGAKAALEDESITLEKALTYALQDEYAAQEMYAAVISKFGSNKAQPFVRIKAAEQEHIKALLPLCKTHQITAPNRHQVISSTQPSSVKAAFKLGVARETENIAMYSKLLQVPGIPPDVQKAMTHIRNDSLNHLAAFEAGLSRSE